MFGPILAALLATAQPAYSMQFSRVPVEDEKVFVFGKGPIIEGDSDRLRDFINNMPATDRIVGFSFDSPGGSILEAEEIAEMIHGTNSLVLIDSGSECLSACFLMFAASPRKAMAADALIGVHSASNRGQETVAAMASTTAMARVAASYDVPPIIIAKMVETKPGRMAWLTPEDLASMDVKIFASPAPTPAPSVAPTPAASPPPVAAPPQVSSAPTYAALPPAAAAFEQGLADRRGWETWFNNLAGAYRAGAQYWSAQRSIPNPGSCVGIGGQSFGDWTDGCVAAQRRLAPTDARRRSEPEYRQGWNSY